MEPINNNNYNNYTTYNQASASNVNTPVTANPYGQAAYSQIPSQVPAQPKKKGPMSKVLLAVAIGLAFGVSAALGLYTVNSLSGGTIFATTKNVDSKEVDDLKDQVKALQDMISTGADNGITVKETVVNNEMVSTVVTDVTEVVDKVMPSMVSITNLYEQTYSFWGRTYTEENEAGGTGIIVGENDSEYLLVTNYHVIEDNVQLTVKFVDDTTADAYVKGADQSIDIAVLGVAKSDLLDETKRAIKVAELGDSNSLKIGEPAIAIGNALGYGQSVTTGVISALNRDIEMENTVDSLIQTNAAINPGNSGGALLNIAGQVVGINSNKIGGNAIEGMGYAIPISDVKEVIETFMNRETRKEVAENDRGYLGVSGASVDETTMSVYGIPQGVYVTKVFEGSAADKAGIIKGDVITKVDGETVKEITELQELLQYYKNGDTVKMVIMRAGSSEYTEMEIQVTLGGKDTIVE